MHFMQAARLRVHGPKGSTTRMRTSMIGNRICAVALSAAFAILSFAPSAIAASFDGTWSMLVVTTSGHCGKIPVGLGISHGRIYSTSGSFVFHPIKLTGSVSGAGHARIAAVAGPRVAKGSGRFSRSRAAGTWSGTGPSGICSGIWSATRS
jgi:hypothetical protein